MNLSGYVFRKLQVIRERHQKRLGVRMSWDLFFLDLCEKLNGGRKR